MRNASETVFLPVAFAERPAWLNDPRANADDGHIADDPLRQPVIRFESQPSFLPQAPERALVIGLIDHYRFTQECLVRALRSLNPADAVTPFLTVGDCIAADCIDLDLIIYYAHDNGASQTMTLSNVAAIHRAYPAVPLVVLSDADDAQQTGASRNMLEGGASGIIPTRTTGIFITIGEIRFVKESGTRVPSENLAPPRGPAVPAVKHHPHLTSREMAVLAHLQRGKANKIIAHELSMSENTVKIHVRNIMRKMDATNRTQAVDKARTLWGGIKHQAVAGASDPPPSWCRRQGGGDRRVSPRHGPR